MKKRIMSLLLAMVMTVSLLPTAAMAAGAEKFDDVSKDDWYYKYVDFVAEEGYFAGTSNTTFSPDMTMTRAMFVVVMAALEGVKVDNSAAPFADVPANTWYSGAVAWAAENGVIAGVGDNKFAPNAEITREQMAVIMNAYINWHGNKFGVDHNEKAKIDTFNDKANVSDWALTAVENCRNWGLIVGAPDGNFYPKNSAARAEVATVVYNLAWLVMGGGGGGGKTDFIYNSLNKALADLQGDLEDNGIIEFEHEKKATTVTETVSFKTSSATITLPSDSKGTVKLWKNIVKAEDGTKTRPQTVDFKVEVTHDTLAEILQMALNQAHYLLNTNVPAGDKADAAKVDAVELKNEIVMPVIRKFEEVTGLNVSADKELVKELVKGTYEYAMAYGASMIDHMQDKNGKYYTGDVTITAADGTEAVIRVAETAYVENKAEQVAGMAVAIAKDLYYDLIADYASAEFIPVEEVALDTTITIAFSDNTTEGNKYEKHTNAYPYVYPVTFSMSFNCEDLGKLVEYRYNNGHDIMFKIPQAVQAKYDEYATKAVEKVLTSDTLKNYAQDKFGLDLDAVMDQAVTEMQGAGAIDELKNTITGLDPTLDADALVTAAMNQWIRDNYTNSGNLLNFVMTGETKFNNGALYGLVEVIAKSAAKTVTDKVADLDMAAVQTKLDSAKATIADAELLFQDKLAELNAAKEQLAEGKKMLEDAKVLLAEKKAEGEKMIADGKAEGEALIAEKKAEGEALIAEKKAEGEALIADAKAEIAKAEAELNEKLNGVTLDEVKAEIADAKIELADTIAELNEIYGSRNKWPSDAKQGVKDAEKQIADLEKKIADAEDAIAKIADAKAQVADAEAQLPIEIAKAEAELAKLVADGEAELAKKIADAEAELAKLVADAEAQIKSYEDLIPGYEQQIKDAEELAGPIPTMIADAKDLLADAQNVVDLMKVALTESIPANLISNLKAVSAAIKAIDMDKVADMNAIGAQAGISVDMSMLDGKAEMIDAMIAEVEALDDEIEPYVIAAVCDALAEQKIGAAGSFTADGEAATEAMHAYIDSMLAEQAEVARDKYMEEMGDAAAEMQAYLDTVSGLLNTFKSFDNIAKISVGDLARVLKNENVTGASESAVAFAEAIAGREAPIGRITALIAKLPAKASVSLGGIEISEAALAELQAADTATEVLVALANVLEQDSELCLDSFADGVDLTVAYGARSATLGLYIVH